MEFEAREIEEGDFHGIRRLLQQVQCVCVSVHVCIIGVCVCICPECLNIMHSYMYLERTSRFERKGARVVCVHISHVRDFFYTYLVHVGDMYCLLHSLTIPPSPPLSTPPSLLLSSITTVPISSPHTLPPCCGPGIAEGQCRPVRADQPHYQSEPHWEHHQGMCSTTCTT